MLTASQQNSSSLHIQLSQSRPDTWSKLENHMSKFSSLLHVEFNFAELWAEFWTLYVISLWEKIYLLSHAISFIEESKSICSEEEFNSSYNFVIVTLLFLQLWILHVWLSQGKSNTPYDKDWRLCHQTKHSNDLTVKAHVFRLASFIHCMHTKFHHKDLEWEKCLFHF